MTQKTFGIRCNEVNYNLIQNEIDTVILNNKATTKEGALIYLLDRAKNNDNSELTTEFTDQINSINQECNAKTAELTKQLAECEQSLTEKDVTINELVERVQELEESISNKTNLLQQLNDTVRANKNKTTDDYLLESLEPLPAMLLNITAEKLTKKYNREVTPTMILVDMFVKYTIEQYSVWFYPFVISDDEIIKIAQTINPDIKNINDLKQTLHNA